MIKTFGIIAEAAIIVFLVLLVRQTAKIAALFVKKLLEIKGISVTNDELRICTNWAGNEAKKMAFRRK